MTKKHKKYIIVKLFKIINRYGGRNGTRRKYTRKRKKRQKQELVME